MVYPGFVWVCSCVFTLSSIELESSLELQAHENTGYRVSALVDKAAAAVVEAAACSVEKSGESSSC